MTENKNENEKLYIKVNNAYYNDESLTNTELTILTLLYWDYQHYKPRTKCSIQMLANMMQIDTNSNTKIITQIKNTLTSLQEKKIITDIYLLNGSKEKIKDKHTFFYVELIKPLTKGDKGGYFHVYEDDLNKIFSYLSGKNISKFDFIRYFLATQRVISNNDNFGYLPQSVIKRLVSNPKTIKRYNEILQKELHLIRYNNDYLTPKYKYCSTFIGLYNDDDKLFDDKVKDMANSQGYVLTDKTKSNEKRKTKQEVNHLKDKIDNSDSTDKDAEIEKLKAELKEKNKQLESLQYKENKKDKNKRIEKEDKDIYDSVNDLYGSNQYEDDQMNPDDIMPESLKITQEYLKKQNNDELDIWGEEEKVEVKECIICKEYYTEDTDIEDWCQNCIDENRIVKKYRKN